MRIDLPYPPSVNSYYATYQGRRILSRKGKAFAKEVGFIVMQHRMAKHLACRLRARVQLELPDKRIRDIDNVLKPLFDAMKKAGIYLDDSQIDELNVIRWIGTKPGKCRVDIDEIVTLGTKRTISQNELENYRACS